MSSSTCTSFENCSSDIIQVNEEVGFFFLHDTIVTIIDKRHLSSQLPSSASFEASKGHSEEEEETNENSTEHYFSGSKVNKKYNYLNNSYFSSDHDDKNWMVSNEWLNVKIVDHDNIDDSKKSNNKGNNDDNHSLLCPRCNLVLQMNNSDNVIQLNVTEKCYFNGLVDDLYCCNNTSSSNSSDRRIKRSDASILLGTILQCRQKEFVRIEKFQILFSGMVDTTTITSNDNVVMSGIVDGSDDILDETEDDGQKEQEQRIIQYHEMKCSIVVTVSLPVLEQVSKITISSLSSTSKKNNQISIDHYDEYLSTSTNGFPPVGQLFFSIMRCDWSWLDWMMDCLKMNNNAIINNRIIEWNSGSDDDDETELSQKQQKQQDFEHRAQNHRQSNVPSMFPSSLSLEELYNRIQGALLMNDISYVEEAIKVQKNSSLPMHNETDHYSCNILSLPADLLQTNIAPYLRAKSLNNLRRTCNFLHHTLKAVVPGMKLTLYPHQVRSLEWMRRRELSCLSEDDAIQSGANNSCLDKVLNGDLFRSVTSGSMISITPRRKGIIQGDNHYNQNNQSSRSFWHVNTWTGACSLHYRSDRVKTVARCRSVARGGLLCDDPGLGKTITILSLILQTFGQFTESINKKTNNESVSDDLIIGSYWRESLVTSTRQHELKSLCLKLRKFDINQYFQQPIATLVDEVEYNRYKNIVENPIALDDVFAKIQQGAYEDSLSLFEEDVEKIYRNAILYYPVGDNIRKRAEYILQEFRNIFDVFRQQQLSAAISVAQKRSKESLCALVAERKRVQLLDTLISSHGTLLVVPHTLVNHWEEQIKMHIEPIACSNKRPLLFRHRTCSNFRRENHVYTEVSDHTIALILCNEGTHFPFLFIDECNKKLPSHKFLANFHIVLTTTKRLTAEWKHGSREEELRKGKIKASSYRSFNYDVFNDFRYSSPCPLLKVHWLRLVVDEGHSMGKRGSPTNAIEFSSWIAADYRWAMTGTPTPQTTNNVGVGNIFGLMKFLKHDYFSTLHWGEERYKAFFKSFKEGHIAAFFRIQHLLNLFMVRHTKKDIEQLHKPRFCLTRTDMSASEIQAYDTLVSAVQMNLITTSMKGKTSGYQDSLLHVRQRVHAKNALNNIRLACSGGTSVIPTLTNENWNETLRFMREIHNADKVKITLVENFLHRMTSEQKTSCMSCGTELQTMFLLPCACQICTECMNPKLKKCLSCGEAFDIDDFQRLQPGLDYQWRWNIVEAKLEREKKRMMEESLRSSASGNNYDNTANINPRRVIDDDLEQRQRQVETWHRRNRKKNDAHVCIYPDIYRDGKCKLCLETHLCNFMDNKVCSVCHAISEDCPKDESKAFYITNKLLELWSLYQNRGIDAKTGRSKRPLKVIIFTQFQQVSNLVGDRLIRRFGTGCIAEYWGSSRNSELERFTRFKDCFCMLLNKDGSHGLNLSFVTHIFFLDEILDKSLESQVVSRAYRMGATENVFVEQLVSRHSIEELIVMMNTRSETNIDLYSNYDKLEDIKSEYYGDSVSFMEENNDCVKSNNTNAKINFLLSNVRLIHPNKRKRSSLHKRTINNMGVRKNKAKSVRFNF